MGFAKVPLGVSLILPLVSVVQQCSLQLLIPVVPHKAVAEVSE